MRGAQNDFQSAARGISQPIFRDDLLTYTHSAVLKTVEEILISRASRRSRVDDLSDPSFQAARRPFAMPAGRRRRNPLRRGGSHRAAHQ